jgi:hypothetical protein
VKSSSSLYPGLTRKISDCSAKFTRRFSSVFCLSTLPRLASVIRCPTLDARFSSVGLNDVVSGPVLASLLAQYPESFHEPELPQERGWDVDEARGDERWRRRGSRYLDRIVEVVDVVALAPADGQHGGEGWPRRPARPTRCW